MIVGETIKITRIETQPDGSAFTATSGSAVVTAPDGTTSSPSVTIAPGTSAPAQVLSLLLTPALGGEYRIRWSYQDSTSETIRRIDVRYATWTDSKQIALNRLQRTDLTLSDALWEFEFSRTAAKLLARYAAIGTPPGTTTPPGVYNGITGTDQAWFDEAAALMACVRMVGPLKSGGAASDLVLEKYGDEQYRYADTGRDRRDDTESPGDAGDGPGGYFGQSERVRWLREAAEAIGNIAVVRAYYSVQAAGFRPFQLSGPTRTKRAAGIVQTILTDSIELLSDSFDLSPAFDGTGL